VPESIRNTLIVVFCFIGAFALRNDMADVWLTMLFGVLGFLMRRYDLPIPPLVMGVILGLAGLLVLAPSLRRLRRGAV